MSAVINGYNELAASGAVGRRGGASDPRSRLPGPMPSSGRRLRRASRSREARPLELPVVSFGERRFCRAQREED